MTEWEIPQLDAATLNESSRQSPWCGYCHLLADSNAQFPQRQMAFVAATCVGSVVEAKAWLKVESCQAENGEVAFSTAPRHFPRFPRCDDQYPRSMNGNGKERTSFEQDAFSESIAGIRTDDGPSPVSMEPNTPPTDTRSSLFEFAFPIGTP